MKPIFTVHAGEYLVGDYIEKHAKRARVWLPSKDTGVDLLVTNAQLSRATSLQVKFSKDFSANKGVMKESSVGLAGRIKARGWWTLDYGKLVRSPAELWILVLYRFSDHDFDFVIIKPDELAKRYRRLRRGTGTIQSYFSVTEDKKCWETRGLGKGGQDAIEAGRYRNPDRDLSAHLNNWGPLEAKLGLQVSH